MSQVNEELTFSGLQTQLYQLNNLRTKTVEEKIKQLYAEGLDAVFMGAGWGEYNKQIVNNFAKLDRYGTRFCMDNYLKVGYTFMTRPELNLQSINLRQNRIMNLLNTRDPASLNFAIRCYLDSRFSRIPDNLDLVTQCPYIDYRSPFFTLITNNLQDFSGGPSYQLSTHTDEEGFFGESQSIAIGSDSYKKPFDLQLNVIDPIGGPIDAIMKFWCKYIELVSRGEMIMYPDQHADRIINYTVSIYRFIMDPTFRYIRKYAKYTGCFPISDPGASVFDYNHSDVFVDSLRKYSIGFKCGSGVVDVDDPIIVDEFNSLVESYYPPIRCLRLTQDRGQSYVNRGLVPDDQIDAVLKNNGLARNPLIPEFNYTGIPYILDTKKGLRMEIIRETREIDKNKFMVLEKVDPSTGQKTGEYDIKWLKMLKTSLDVATATTTIDAQTQALISQYETQREQQINSKSAVSYI